MTPQQRRQLTKLAPTNPTIQEAQALTGLSYQNVYNFLKRNGYKYTKYRGKKGEREIPTTALFTWELAKKLDFAYS
jgi:transposase